MPDTALAETSDASPTVANIAIDTFKGAAWVTASLELVEDTDIANQMAMIFVDARDRLESVAFNVGNGSMAPEGIWTSLDANTNVELQTTTASTIGIADLEATYEALPARWRRNASWLMAPTWLNVIRDLGTQVSASFTTTASDQPSRLFEKPIYVDDDAPITVSTNADNRIVFGDFSQFIVVRRVGMSVSFVPVVVGTNARPIGASGWYAHWRSGSGTSTDLAFRLLQDKAG